MYTAVRPDIRVESPNGETVALVEVRNRPGFSLDDAVELRRTLADYGLGIYVPYFLIVSQDLGFLWTQPWRNGADASSVQQFSMQPVIAHYQPDLPPAERLTKSSVEYVVTQWLNHIAAGRRRSEEEPERSLVGTGFLEALKDAVIFLEPLP